MKYLHSLASLAALHGLVSAVIEPERLTLDGIMTAATCGSDAANTGGTIVVNGYTVTIPENTIFSLPASWTPFKTICGGGFTGNEVSVVGNIIDGKAIAGIVTMAPVGLMIGSGYIASIDGAAGTMKITGGPTIRINDPNGVYGVPYTDAPAWTADDENPSISAFSGFPMCIPRSASDDLCPLSNRPAGQKSFAAPDPLVMAPFQVGDYLEFAGIVSGSTVICYEITATNVQITSSSPVYIRVEEALVGVYDGDANSEFGDTRIVGYLSDPAASVVVSAIDVDRCTGEETLRTLGGAVQKVGDVRNKFTWRASSNTFVNYSREYIVKVDSGTKTTKNGIVAGQYVQPMEFIMPEVLTPGIDPPKYDFSNFRFLADGIVNDGAQFGQLNPWPDTAPPTTPGKCTSPPVADPSPTTPTDPGATFTPLPTPNSNAGNDFSHIPGSVVTLSGSSNSTDIPSGNLTYKWTQISGPTVTLVGADSPKCSFTAAAQAAASPTVPRKFQLTVGQKSDSTVNGTSSVTATGDRSKQDVVTIQAFTWTNQQGGTLSVVAQSNVVVDKSAALKLFLGTSTTAITMTPGVNGQYSYGARSVKQPASVKVTSVYGGTASRTTLTTKKRRGLERFTSSEE